jgi:hypothetical protein
MTNVGSAPGAPLRVLITNVVLWPRSGTVLYVRDLALELLRQGHAPAVFSLPQGEVAAELRAAGVPVERSLRRLPRPDVIHGHHHAPARLAIRHWPTVPAIYLCHAHAHPDERALLHPAVRRYFGVSRLCVERLVREGVDARDVALLPNFVDLARFTPRAPLPPRPRRALVLSNHARAETHLPAVVEACRRAGLPLDVVGDGVGRPVAEPERILGEYDVVFAKAKAAMEAMAVGAAVVLCDFGGVGPMVGSAGFDALRPLNFGFEALRDPLAPEPLLRELARYDPDDAARVRDRLRACAGLEHAVAGLVDVYCAVIAEHALAPPASDAGALPALVRERLYLRAYWAWRSLPPARRALLQRLGGTPAVRGALRRLVGAD